MINEYLKKYKHVSFETFAYLQKSTYGERQEFIYDSARCIKYIGETLEKMPCESGNLKNISETIIRLIRDLNIPCQQIEYEINNKNKES